MTRRIKILSFTADPRMLEHGYEQNLFVYRRLNDPLPVRACNTRAAVCQNRFTCFADDLCMWDVIVDIFSAHESPH